MKGDVSILGNTETAGSGLFATPPSLIVQPRQAWSLTDLTAHVVLSVGEFLVTGPRQVPSKAFVLCVSARTRLVKPLA